MRLPRWSPTRLDTDEWEFIFPGGLRIRFEPDDSALQEVDTAS